MPLGALLTKKFRQLGRALHTRHSGYETTDSHEQQGRGREHDLPAASVRSSSGDRVDEVVDDYVRSSLLGIALTGMAIPVVRSETLKSAALACALSVPYS
jgi:hypothetical protein